ncbi:MAG: GntR family transcriptional regulator, partial [Dermatophilaceae bacterium]|nr:GntR family transcriptional regulator [Dermatophilaceae bacterium]
MTAVTLPDQILEGPVPKHRQLRDVLARLAVPGEAIPSERDLTATYGVSRATVRKAIDTLVYEGLLQRTHGLGTFAIRPRLGTQLHLASFTQDMHRRGMVPSTRLVSIRREVPPDPIARALGLGPLDRAWSLRRLRLADGQAIALEDAWYPVSLLPDLDHHDLESSLYALFQNQYGLTIDGAEQTLWGEA